jgi:hypothetical protein
MPKVHSTKLAPSVVLPGLVVLAGCGPAMSLGAPLASPTLEPPRHRFASGDAALCAVRAPGELVCWGKNIGGDHMSARGGLTDVVEVAVGDNHVCALRATGAVICFGKNDHGQLGDPKRPDAASEELLPVPGLPLVTRIAAYGDATCAVTMGGDVYCFGAIATLARGASGRAPATLVKGVSGVLQVSVGPSVACVVRRDGTAMCWGGTPDHVFGEELAGVHDAEEVATSGIVRCVRSRPVDRGGTGAVQCTPQPSPTQEVNLPPAGPSQDTRWTISARDVSALHVDWATACVVREGGNVECTGYDGGRPVSRRELSDLDGSDAISLIDQSIGCGIDRSGGVHTKSKAVGFCGERSVVSDGTGHDPTRGGDGSYSADLAPRVRLGAAFSSGAGHDVDGAFATGVHLPFLFGTGLRAGPILDFGTRGFSTAEPSGGLGVLAGSRFLVGLDAGVGHAFAEGTDARTFGMLTGSVGLGEHINDPGCESRCGARYLTGAGLEVSVRRSLTSGHPNDVGLFFSFDPVVLVLPFVALGADWSFH